MNCKTDDFKWDIENSTHWSDEALIAVIQEAVMRGKHTLVFSVPPAAREIFPRFENLRSSTL